MALLVYERIAGLGLVEHRPHLPNLQQREKFKAGQKICYPACVHKPALSKLLHSVQTVNLWHNTRATERFFYRKNKCTNKPVSGHHSWRKTAGLPYWKQWKRDTLGMPFDKKTPWGKADRTYKPTNKRLVLHSSISYLQVMTASVLPRR